MIQDCLRYWVAEYRVDGFRFDLASILGRNEDGSPMENPPLVKNLAYDSLLADTKLIAEAWDAGGLYQVGSFPAFRRWSEWNGRYRDDVREYLKGGLWAAGAALQRIAGSPDIYDTRIRGKHASVNFLTCHDGFTLYDLYSYNQKHNEANGWGNLDGSDDNRSWNCGAEGDTDQVMVVELRHRMMKNAFAVLLCSRGTPMFLAGDEFGNTQFGNNNAYCQDNATGWTDWKGLSRNQGLREFVKDAIVFRKAHPVLHMPVELKGVDYLTKGFPDVSLHGERAWYLSYENTSRLLGMMYYGAYAREKEDLEAAEDDFIYIGYNFHWENRSLALPNLPEGMCWKKIADTSLHGTGFCLEEEEEYKKSIEIGPRAIVVLLGRQEAEKDAIMAPVAALQDHHEA